MRVPALAEQVLDRLQQGQQRALVVERPPPVHGQPVLAVRHDAGERRMGPASGGPVLGRRGHDVLVGHEQYGSERGRARTVTGPCQAQQESRAADRRDFGRGEQGGVELPQQGVEVVEDLCGLGRQRTAVGRRDRGDADQLRQAAGEGGRVMAHAATSSSGSACESGDDVKATFGTVRSVMSATTAVTLQMIHTVT